eukprot:CAMPEP_0196767902 /NCGR_PEP_ID=MMETSP1095-20130614/42098_1 /TAXON_ID=96789 ORGANISM="Chromulina nebulosa, Strain UTEXLB2642" /NCGR_SAMPLE_ID=MMETSP1095 /ASSEMBLY_ACC=CAM_ASM_000446 /LENGTH=358 /DNA_ID=CAMNT_0042136715 /DNA_START=796 /DNA_END=1872 /DNA_ORIENTATION=-
MVANKTDVIPYEELSAHTRALIENAAKAADTEVIPMSNISDFNIGSLKIKACDKLLEARVDAKLSAGRLKNDVMSRITVAMPKLRSNQPIREAYIPDSVKNKQNSVVVNEKVTEKQLMWQNGGPGVYACDYRKYYLLEEDEWKFDIIPEFMDGRNIMDYFDADIEERLRSLEEEEAELEAKGVYEPEDEDPEDLNEEEMILYDTIKEKKELSRLESSMKDKKVHQKKILIRSRTEDDIREQLESFGLESDGVIEHTRGRKRTRSLSKERDDDMDTDGNEKSKHQRSRSHVRSQSATRGPTNTSVPPNQVNQVKKSVKSLERKIFKYARRGEADHEHYPKLVKHLNSGKRSLGTSTIGR